MGDKNKHKEQMTLSADDRQDLLAVTDYIADIHHAIDPDFFRIEKDRLTAFGAALEKTDRLDVALDVAYDDILFLQTLVDAALEYSQRKSTGVQVSVPQPRLEALNRSLSQAADALFRGKTSQGGA